jgi:hypothetical protein
MPDQEMPLASGWQGVNRVTAPYLLPPSLSPDTYNAAPDLDVEGRIGPRRGRSRILKVANNIIGMVPFSVPWGNYNLVAMDDGTVQPIYIQGFGDWLLEQGSLALNLTNYTVAQILSFLPFNSTNMNGTPLASVVYSAEGGNFPASDIGIILSGSNVTPYSSPYFRLGLLARGIGAANEGRYYTYDSSDAMLASNADNTCIAGYCGAGSFWAQTSTDAAGPGIGAGYTVKATVTALVNCQIAVGGAPGLGAYSAFTAGSTINVFASSNFGFGLLP